MSDVKTEDNASTSTEEVVTPKNDDNTQLTEVLETATKLAEELKKAQEERENYKQGMLLREKKLKDLKSQGIYEDPEDEEDKDARIVNRVVEAIKPLIAQPVKQEESEVEKLQKRLSELTVAVSNRNQVTTVSAGNSTESAEVTKEFWSPAQLEYFKKIEKETGISIDPNKVKENMAKVKENAV